MLSPNAQWTLWDIIEVYLPLATAGQYLFLFNKYIIDGKWTGKKEKPFPFLEENAPHNKGKGCTSVSCIKKNAHEK